MAESSLLPPSFFGSFLAATLVLLSSFSNSRARMTRPMAFLNDIRPRAAAIGGA